MLKWTIHQLRLLPFGESEPAQPKRGKARQPARCNCSEVGGPLKGQLVKLLREWARIPSPLLVADEVANLPAGAFEELRRLGLLVPEGTAKAVGCEACEIDHVEWVATLSDRSGAPRYFIDCPEKGRVEVARRRLQRWAVDFTPLARAVKEGFAAFGSVEQLLPGRLWRLGRAPLGGRSRELWMLRDVSRGRAQSAVKAIPKTGNHVVFLLAWPPGKGLLELGDERLFDALKVVHLRGGGFHVDRHAIERRLRAKAGEGGATQTQLLCCCG